MCYREYLNRACAHGSYNTLPFPDRSAFLQQTLYGTIIYCGFFVRLNIAYFVLRIVRNHIVIVKCIISAWLWSTQYGVRSTQCSNEQKIHSIFIEFSHHWSYLSLVPVQTHETSPHMVAQGIKPAQQTTSETPYHIIDILTRVIFHCFL